MKYEKDIIIVSDQKEEFANLMAIIGDCQRRLNDFYNNAKFAAHRVAANELHTLLKEHPINAKEV